jgi:ribosomal protein L13E
MYTIRSTVVEVESKAISARLDEDAQRALAELEATGLSRTEAVRLGLLAAAQQLRDRSRLEEEVAALAADAEDLAEARRVAAMMEDLRDPW